MSVHFAKLADVVLMAALFEHCLAIEESGVHASVERELFARRYRQVKTLGVPMPFVVPAEYRKSVEDAAFGDEDAFLRTCLSAANELRWNQSPVVARVVSEVLERYMALEVDSKYVATLRKISGTRIARRSKK